MAIIQRREKITELYLAGRSQNAIAQELGISCQLVSQDLYQVRQQWLASSLRDFDEAKAQELAKIDRLEAVAWEGWHKSTLDVETLKAVQIKGRVNQAGDPLPDLQRVAKEQKGQSGDPRFLERVAWCIETRLKIMGALRPDGTQNVTIVTVVGGIDVAAVIGEKPGVEAIEHDEQPEPEPERFDPN